MRIREGLGDYPTVKLSVEEVARYAKEADARVVEAESLGRRSTLRPDALGDSDIEVTVELAESGEFAEAHDLSRREETADAKLEGVGVRTSPEEAANTDDQSDIRLAPRPSEGPPPMSVPCVVAAKEDLSWFQLDETSHVVLAMIDGESTVEDIVSTLSLPRASTLAILRELGTHGVVEFR
jgi:hypothetical protein